MIYDYCVIGGGIVGLATAMKLLEMRPGASLVLLEKEKRLGLHQTGHNSGVIHSGIYYAPGSLKAELCRQGAEATKAFCTEHNIPFEVCGKLLVATDATEAQRMDALFERAKQNRIEVDRLDADALRREEPNITGVGALFVHATGIVDYRRVCDAMGQVIRSRGAAIEFGVAVGAIEETPSGVIVRAGGRSWTARRLIACAGLQSDRLAKIAGLKVEHQIIPFRGEYLPAATEQERYRTPSDLPDSRSRPAVSRRASHAHDRRQRDGRPERRARVRSGGLPQILARSQRRDRVRAFPGVLEDDPE